MSKWILNRVIPVFGLLALYPLHSAFAQTESKPSIASTPSFDQSQPKSDPFDDDRWHFSVGIPFWVSSTSGDLQTPHYSDIPVGASFSQILSHFTFGWMTHAEAKRNCIGIGLDLLYVNLSDTLDIDRASSDLKTLTLGMKQLFAEGFLFYRPIEQGNKKNPDYVDFLGGFRYYWTQSEINQISTSLGFVDLMVGFRAGIAFGDHFSIRPRADFAFFGSTFTWNLVGDAVWTFSEQWAASAGYRAMDIEYANGDTQKKWNVNYHGPSSM